MEPSILYAELAALADTPEGKALYILAVICALMILDYITGTAAAWYTGTLASGRGISGILRKLCSMMVLVACIPIAPLVPAEAGTAALIVLYAGYMLCEARSVLKNLGKLGISISPLSDFLDALSPTNSKSDKNEKDGDKQ
jgi:toxin secretion/phage lysis holin